MRTESSDLGSRNGTVVINGVDRSKTVVAPPKGKKGQSKGAVQDVDAQDADGEAELASDGASESEIERSEDSKPERGDGSKTEESIVEVEPDDRIDAELVVSDAIEIHPGDELILAGDTVFALVAGLPE